MNIGKDPLIHLKQFAAHENVQIAAVDSKGNFSGTSIVLKKLDIAHLSCQKLKKYHEEGRIAFILDGQHVHFNKTFADKHFIDLGVCQLKVKPVSRHIKGSEEIDELLEDVSVEHLNQDDYDEILKVCHEVLEAFTKERQRESALQGKVKATGSYTDTVHLALKNLLIKNVLHEMGEITRRFIESMQKAREEEAEAQKADSKKQLELKQRLAQERLKYEINKNEIEKSIIVKDVKQEGIISDDKRASLERKTGKPIAEHQS